MAGQDFTVTITGNVTGFDVAPINNVNTALKQLPSSASQAANGGNQVSTSFNQASSSATGFTSPLNSVRTGLASTATSTTGLINPLNTLRTTTTSTGQGFQATGALANNFGSTLVTTSGNTQTLVGANGALGTSFAPVQGGLTGTNTLLDQNGVAMQTGVTNSTNYHGALVTLVGGFTTLIGSGLQLFETFHQLETAQVRAEAAHLKYTKALEASRKAHEAVNKLVAEGKEGTAAYTTAVNKAENADTAAAVAADRYKLAQDNLNVTQANFAQQILPTVISSVGGVVTAFGSIKAVVPTLVGGFNSLKTQLLGVIDSILRVGSSATEATTGMGDMGDAADEVGSSVGDAAGQLSDFKTLVGAAGAALGPTAAALVGMKVGMDNSARSTATATSWWDQAGVAVGNLIPPLQGSLTGLRDWTNVAGDTAKHALNDLQLALTGTGDKFDFMNAKMSDLIIRFKEMGTTGQASIDAWLKPIVDGAAKSGVSIDQLIARTKAWETSNADAAQQMENLGNTLLTLGSRFIQLGGDGQRAMDILIKAHEAHEKAVDSDRQKIAEYALAHGQVIDVSKLSEEQLHKLAAVYTAVGSSEQKEISTAAEWLVAHGKVGLVAQVGIDAAIKYASAQVKLEEAHKKAGGAANQNAKSEETYAQQLAKSIEQTNNQAAALLKSVSAGQQYAKTLADLAKAYADAVVKTADFTTKLTDATAIQQRHSIAVQEGINKALEFGVKLQDEATSTQAYNAALDQATGFTQKFGGILPATSTNLENLAKAMMGDQAAANAFVKAFDEATQRISDDGQKMVDDIAGKIDTLGKTVKESKVLKDLPKDVLKALTPDQKDFAVQLAIWKKFGDDVAGGLNIAFQQAGGQFNAAGIEAADNYLQGLAKLKGIQDSPELQNFLAGMHSTFEQAAAIGGQGGKDLIVQFLAKMEQQGGTSGTLAKTIAENMGLTDLVNQARVQGAAAGGALSGGIIDAIRPVPEGFRKNIIEPINATPTPAQAAAQKIGDAFLSIGTALEQVPGFIINIFSTGFNGAMASAATQLGALPPLITGVISQTTPAWATMATAAGAGFNAVLAAASTQLGALVPMVTGIINSMTGAWVGMANVASAGFNAVLAAASTQLGALVPLVTGIINSMTGAWTGMANVASAGFNAILAAASTQLGVLPTMLTGIINSMTGLWAGMVIAASTAFNQIMASASTQLGLLPTMLTGIINQMVPVINSLAVAFTTAFNTAVQNAAGSMNQLATNVQTNIANIIAACNAVPIAFTSNFNKAAQNAAGVMNELAKNVQTNIANMIAASNAIPVAFTANFNKAAVNAAGSMNALAVNVQTNIQNMIAATNAFAIAITTNFSKGAQNAAGSMNALASNVASNTSAMVSNINRVVSAMNQIGSAASSARSQVQSLISSINSIPSSKTVTINIIEHRTVVTRTVPAGPASAVNAATAGGGTVNTTVLAPGIATAGKAKIIRLEITEPTVVRVDSRELIKLINKKLLDLDIGALI